MPATFVKSITQLIDLPDDDKPQIALVGRSNVGKSSLLNQLTDQKGLARASAEPGRTQTINVFDVDGRFYLIDLPGYGFAKASKVKRVGLRGMISDYISEAPQLKLVLLILDARRGFTELDLEVAGYLEAHSIPYALVVNKIDKLSKSEYSSLAKKIALSHPGVPIIPSSNVTRVGRGQIRQTIEEVIR